MPKTIDKLCDIVKKTLGIESESISADTELTSLELDSLDTLELVMKVEEEFDVEIDPAILNECITVGDLFQKIS